MATARAYSYSNLRWYPHFFLGYHLHEKTFIEECYNISIRTLIACHYSCRTFDGDQRSSRASPTAFVTRFKMPHPIIQQHLLRITGWTGKRIDGKKKIVSNTICNQSINIGRSRPYQIFFNIYSKWNQRIGRTRERQRGDYYNINARFVV